MTWKWITNTLKGYSPKHSIVHVTSWSDDLGPMPEPDENRVPDYIEPLVGHRVFRLGSQLTSWFTYEEWPARAPLVARCRCRAQGDICAAPQLGCTCGIYAYKTEHDAFAKGPNDPFTPYAYGEVDLWGRIIEHDYGYRAQYAYPKNITIFVPPGQPFRVTQGFHELCKDWEERYGIPFTLGELPEFDRNKAEALAALLYAPGQVVSYPSTGTVIGGPGGYNNTTTATSYHNGYIGQFWRQP